MCTTSLPNRALESQCKISFIQLLNKSSTRWPFVNTYFAGSLVCKAQKTFTKRNFFYIPRYVSAQCIPSQHPKTKTVFPTQRLTPAQEKPGKLLPGSLHLDLSFHSLCYGLPGVSVEGLPSCLCCGLYGVPLLWRDPYIYSGLLGNPSLVSLCPGLGISCVSHIITSYQLYYTLAMYASVHNVQKQSLLFVQH